jgi:SAM-dependent methyltransferase
VDTGLPNARPSFTMDTLNPYRTIRHYLWRFVNKPFPAGPHVTRYFYYDHLKKTGERLPNRNGARVLSISHSENLAPLLGLQPSEIVSANYPDVSILALPYPDNSFDYVLSDQVFEHIEGDPFEAARECHRVLKPGGIAVHTTCFNVHIHGSPRDFWRFTPDALRLLHRDWSEVIEVGGWGNQQVWTIVAKDGMRWRGVPPLKWHPMNRIAMKNDPLWPIVTWVIARK